MGQVDEAVKNAGLFNQYKFLPHLPGYLSIIKIRPEKMTVSSVSTSENKTVNHVLLADMLFEARQYADCVREYRKAVELNPDDIAVHYYLLAALVESGNWIAAVQEDFIISHNIVSQVPNGIKRRFSGRSLP